MKTLALLLFLEISALAQFVTLDWENPPNAEPCDWVVFRTSPTVTGNPTNWPFLMAARGWVSQDPVPADGSFILWVNLTNEFRAVYVSTNTANFVTNKIIQPSSAAVPTNGLTQFFILQYSNNNGTVSPFSNPVGTYAPKTNAAVWMRGR